MASQVLAVAPPSLADPTRPLRDALQQFQSVLSIEDSHDLERYAEVPDSTSALVFTASLDRINPNRRGSSVATRLYPLLQSIQQFCGILDSFASSSRTLPAILWGSTKFTMEVSSEM
jgi:hypothetical protein